MIKIFWKDIFKILKTLCLTQSAKLNYSKYKTLAKFQSKGVAKYMQPRIAISACTMMFLQVDPLGTVFMYLQTYFKQEFHMHLKGP